MKSQLMLQYPAKPLLQRDVKGRITHGISQSTNKRGTAGRPCNYCLNKKKILLITNKYIEDNLRVINGKYKMPFIEELALILNTSEQNIWNWCHKVNSYGEEEHPEFFDVIKKLKTLQKLRLMQRCLGRYNPTGAIYLLKTHHKMIEEDKRKLINAKNEPLKIIIVEDSPSSA